MSTLFDDLYGYKINSSTVLEALNQAHEAAPLKEAANRQEILVAPYTHFDETGIRVNGKLHWLHTASTETITHLFVHEKRGLEALKSATSVLKDYRGITVHDCWKPYFHFNQARHVLCGANLLRELKKLEEDGKNWAAEMHVFLLGLLSIVKIPEMIDVFRANYSTEIVADYDAILKSDVNNRLAAIY